MNHQRLLTLIYSALPCRRGELSVIREALFVFYFLSLSLRPIAPSRATSDLSLSLSPTRPVFQISAAPP